MNVLAQLQKLDTTQFTKENKVNYSLFKKQYENSIEAHAYQTFLIPFSHRGGIQLQHETTSIVPLRNTQHYLDWIERISKIDELVEASIARAKIGIEENIVPPRFLMQKVYNKNKAINTKTSITTTVPHKTNLVNLFQVLLWLS